MTPWTAVRLAALLLTLVLAWRNWQVRTFRHELLAQMLRAGSLDYLAGGAEFHWRLEAYDRVSYDQMLWQFWRPLESFYPDKRFLVPLPPKATP